MPAGAGAVYGSDPDPRDARFYDHAAVSEASLQALSGPHRVSDRRGAGAAVFTCRGPGTAAGRASGKDRLFLLLHGGCGRARGKKRGNCGNCRDVCGKRDGTSGTVFPDIHRLDAGGVGMESAFVHGFVADSRALDHIHDSQTLIMRRSCEKMGQILSVCTR